MPKRIAVLLDGGHLRTHARKAGLTFDPELIEKFALSCRNAAADEEILRVLYYDCAPFHGTAILPVSGQKTMFQGSDQWLHDLAHRDLFAVCRGVLKFRGFVLKKIPYTPSGPLQDADFHANFEQKGVDMRIGLDMANYSSNRSVDLLALATNDTDCTRAMKHARRAGLQVALIVVPGYKPAPELLAHADFQRAVAWP